MARLVMEAAAVAAELEVREAALEGFHPHGHYQLLWLHVETGPPEQHALHLCHEKRSLLHSQ